MNNSSETVKKYQEYNWSQSDKWLKYLETLYPTPSGQQLEKFKRKWYQNNIDQNLAIDFDQAYQQTTSGNNTTSNQQPENNQSRQPAQPASQQPQAQSSTVSPNLKESIYKVEGIAKFLFFGSILVYPQLTNMLAVGICLMAIVRQNGIPQFSKEYGKKVIQNEFAQNLLYMLPFIIVGAQISTVIYFPLCLHFFIGICEYSKMKLSHTALFRYQQISSVIETVRAQKNIIMVYKCKIEFMIFIYLIISILLGKTSFLLLLIYGNFLRIKYVMSQNMIRSIAEIDYWITTKLNHPAAPPIIRTVYGKIKYLASLLVKF